MTYTKPFNHNCSSYLAGKWHKASGESFHAWDPVNHVALDGVNSCSREDVDVALQAAKLVACELKQKSGEDIANFLNKIADEIESLGNELILTAMQETGLPEARLLGERGRTCGQLRAFSVAALAGLWVQASIDTAQPNRNPLPKPDIRSLFVPIGPVVVFAASNFPFAFGCVGGDTASALAGGNPVVVKGHPSHPATSSLFAQAVDKAIFKCNFPLGTFSLLQGNTYELGNALVAHPFTEAVGFTGSTRGGRALMDVAAARPKPITVYAEMGSINPVFIMPDAIERNEQDIALGLSTSIAMGTGQFCTSPGLIITLSGNFAEQLAKQLTTQPRGIMLNPAIANSLHVMVNERILDNNIELLTGGSNEENELQPFNTLLKTSVEHFLARPTLLDEVFGPIALLVECSRIEQMIEVAQYLEGNLTATIHTSNYEDTSVKKLLSILTNTAGRVLFNGYPTGVEVCPSMQHGGSYPASSAPATTSVGTAAMSRFVRRTAFQDCPEPLLPLALQNSNSLNLWRQVNGEFTKSPICSNLEDESCP
jgi:NADP-dependent aldehyde dehydrogenase